MWKFLKGDGGGATVILGGTSNPESRVLVLDYSAVSLI